MSMQPSHRQEEQNNSSNIQNKPNSTAFNCYINNPKNSDPNIDTLQKPPPNDIKHVEDRKHPEENKTGYDLNQNHEDNFRDNLDNEQPNKSDSKDTDEYEKLDITKL